MNSLAAEKTRLLLAGNTWELLLLKGDEGLHELVCVVAEREAPKVFSEQEKAVPSRVPRLWKRREATAERRTLLPRTARREPKLSKQ